MQDVYHRRLFASNFPSDEFQSMDPCSDFMVHDFATVAQLVEQLICNQLVGGSSPSGGSSSF